MRSSLGSSATLLLLTQLIACGIPVGSAPIDDVGDSDPHDADITPFEDADSEGDTAPVDARDAQVELDVTPDGGDTTDGFCDDEDDCPVGFVCIDFGPGDNNAICAAPCVDATTCPDGFDCILLGGGADQQRACIDPLLCIDGDRDAYGFGPGCDGLDCDDDQASINPGAIEICNATDDDCDTRVDNNPSDEGDDCASGFAGVCAEGRIACTGGVPECVPRVAPSDELCDGADNDCDGTVDEEPLDARFWYPDVDGDRFGDSAAATLACTAPVGTIDVAGDCDDTVRAVSPAATEVCDGLDNDCNGVIDGPGAIGITTFWIDADGDGFGDAALPVSGCALADGWADNDDDCDDTEAAINPDADELCDGVDNDCNDVLDDGSGPGAGFWYADLDGDGYGNTADVVFSCDVVPGRITRPGDCDDAAPAVNPAAAEVCDGIDNNCVGGNDEPTAVGAPIWYRDADADGYGGALGSLTACTAPGGFVATSNDCDDANASRNPGRAEVCDGLDNNCDSLVDNGVGTTFFYDTDGDTWGGVSVVACAQPASTSTRGGDCNDSLAAVNPGASEVCATAYDDDCDGAVNEADAVDASTWFLDTDDDGQGGEAPLPIYPLAQTACTRPADWCPVLGLCFIESYGYVDNDDDCDDSTGLARRPVPPEVRTEACDGYDNDCNGTRDDGLTRSLTAYYDGDDDGYGVSPAIPVCAVPAGYAATCCDRDDDDDTYH